MNIITMTVVGAGILAFGPGFLAQAALGYVAGTAAGAYAENRMRRLHNEICRHTGDDPEAISKLGSYVVKASQVGGVLCPVIPLVSVGVGMYCGRKAASLARAEAAAHAPAPTPAPAQKPRPAFTPGRLVVARAGGRL